MTRKLKEIFLWNFQVLSRALEENDVAEAARMLKKKEHYFGTISYFDHGKQSKEMAELFISHPDKDWQRWGFKENARETLLRMFFRQTLAAGRTDLVETYFKAGLSFRAGDAPHHEIAAVLQSGMDNAAKAALTAKFIEAGIDKVTNTGQFLHITAATSATAAFDLLQAELKADVHKNNEALLRQAGAHGQKEMAYHLVLRHGADIDLAIVTERTLGHEEIWRFLETVRKEMRPNESAPHTIDSLSAEMKSLRAEMQAMKEELTALRAAVPVPAPATVQAPKGLAQ